DGCEEALIAILRAGEREDAGAFHEERSLLRIEHREALVDLHLKRIALHLTEIRMYRGVEGDRLRQANLRAEAESGRVASPGPATGGVQLLIRRKRCRRYHIARWTALQLRHDQRRVFFEHPGP